MSPLAGQRKRASFLRGVQVAAFRGGLESQKQGSGQHSQEIASASRVTTFGDPPGGRDHDVRGTVDEEWEEGLLLGEKRC